MLSGLILFVPAVLFSILTHLFCPSSSVSLSYIILAVPMRECFSTLTPLFCPSSSVSLSYIILAVPMRECLGKHSCMSSPFSLAILNGTSSFLFGAREYKHAQRTLTALFLKWS